MVKVSVKDNGSPSLSNTNTFTVTVAPGSAALGRSVSVTPGQITLTVSGQAGPDYILQTSTDLSTWQPLLTTNPPSNTSLNQVG